MFVPVALGAAVACCDSRLKHVEIFACLLSVFLLLIGGALGDKYSRRGEVEDKRGGKKFRGRMALNTTLSLVGAGCCFTYLAMVGGWVIVGGVAVLAVGIIGHRKGVFPFSTIGGEEIFTFFFFYLVACGTHYIHAKSVTGTLLLAALPTLLLINAAIVVNNLKNFDRDKKAGKTNLVLTQGRYRAIVYYKVLLAASYAIPFGLAISSRAGAFILLPLCTMPMARSLAIKVDCDLGANLAHLLSGTARLALVYGLMLAFGFIYYI